MFTRPKNGVGGGEASVGPEGKSSGSQELATGLHSGPH
jgi:hypothetical protein